MWREPASCAFELFIRRRLVSSRRRCQRCAAVGWILSEAAYESLVLALAPGRARNLRCPTRAACLEPRRAANILRGITTSFYLYCSVHRKIMGRVQARRSSGRGRYNCRCRKSLGISIYRYHTARSSSCSQGGLAILDGAERPRSADASPRRDPQAAGGSRRESIGIAQAIRKANDPGTISLTSLTGGVCISVMIYPIQSPQVACPGAPYLVVTPYLTDRLAALALALALLAARAIRGRSLYLWRVQRAR